MALARYLVGDVFEQLDKLDDGSIDFVMTSPPFIGLREYLPAGHPDKDKEIGLEPTPAVFVDTMLALVAAIRPKLAPHASIAIELGDTYSESGGAGGDYYNEDGWRADQPKPRGSARLEPRMREGRPRFDRPGHVHRADRGTAPMPVGNGGSGWPLGKSKAMIPELLRIALGYGLNPLTGQASPAGLWRIRNVVTWCRTNPPVGALGDKFRTATSDIVVACIDEERWWDEVSIRVPASPKTNPRTAKGVDVAPPTGKTSAPERGGGWATLNNIHGISATAPPLDWWNISAAGYPGAHHAVYPPELCVTPIKAMTPHHVCTDCGEPRRPIVETTNSVGTATARGSWIDGAALGSRSRDYTDQNAAGIPEASDKRIVGWTHCACHAEHGCRATVFEFTREPVLDEVTGEPVMSRTTGKPKTKRVRTVVEPGWCNENDANGEHHWRAGVVLDPFGGSGTTGMVATGHGRDAILIDIDERNAVLAEERIGPLFFQLGM